MAGLTAALNRGADRERGGAKGRGQEGCSEGSGERSGNDAEMIPGMKLSEYFLFSFLFILLSSLAGPSASASRGDVLSVDLQGPITPASDRECGPQLCRRRSEREKQRSDAALGYARRRADRDL